MMRGEGTTHHSEEELPLQSPAKQIRWMSRAAYLLTLSAVAFVAAVLSILVLAFKADSSVVYNDLNSDGGGGILSLVDAQAPNGVVLLSAYPQFLKLGPVQYTLATAGISLSVACGIGALCAFVHRRGKALLLSDYQRAFFFLLLNSNCFLPFAVFVLTLVLRLQSATFDPHFPDIPGEYQGSWEVYGDSSSGHYGDTFEIGSWACQVLAYSDDAATAGGLSRQCTDEAGALWTALILTLVNIVMASLIWIDWKGQRVMIRNLRSVMDEYAIDYLGVRDPYA